ncbi:MAG: lipoprotein [Burkholderiaceae bacterium]|jgi:predicted small lipoprotein YifL|nr:lipoprotein [Burkholderiaceae bacterium]
MFRSAILVLAVALAGLGGCGQKGSLYLPNEPASAGRATLVQTLLPGTARAPASSASAAAPAPAPPPPESIFD